MSNLYVKNCVKIEETKKMWLRSTRMGDEGIHSLFLIYSYNPHDSDNGLIMDLKPTFLRYNVIHYRFVRIVIRLRIRCYCFIHLGPRRGCHFLSDWGSMSLTGHTAPLSERLCAPLRVGRPSRISTLSCTRKNGLRGSVKP